MGEGRTTRAGLPSTLPADPEVGLKRPFLQQSFRLDRDDGAVAASRVVVVEDDDALRVALVEALRRDGYVVEALASAAGFSDLITVFRPHLLVLDVMLPGGRDGFGLARDGRAHGGLGIVVLTARDAVEDRLRGFESGADDYLIKPFSMAELLARVRALLRRLGEVTDVLQVGDLIVDEGASLATRAGATLPLTATELRLLVHLASRPGRTLSKTVLLTQVWGYGDFDPNLVEVHMSALRRKTEEHGPRLIHTVRGLGYVLRV
jgi:two-component system OmpR family response regulator